MDKKTLPIIVLLVLAIVFYIPILKFLGLYTPSEQPVQQADTTSQEESPAPDTHQQPTDFADTEIREVQKPPRDTDQPAADTIPVDTITISTNKYVVTLTNQGGGPISILLKEYDYKNGDPVQMLPDADAVTPDAYFAGGTFATSELMFNSDLIPDEYDATRDTIELTYTYISADGAAIHREYRFYPDEYHFDLYLTLDQPQKMGLERQYTLMWNTPLMPTEPQQDKDYGSMQAVAMMSGSREALDDWEGSTLDQSLDGYTEWAGVRSKYFAAAMIPLNRVADRAVAHGEKSKISTPEGRIEQRLITAGMVLQFAAVTNLTDSFTVFVGPMDYLVMDDYGVDLEAILDIATMPFLGTVILKPFALGIMWLLPKMYNLVPNYGLVIILFALVIKVITLPLSLKQFKSMQAMKDVAPEMERLKQKYKKDPQGLQKATMKMYKERGVNPMSGCLVMLPQMPLMIAMFRVFQATVLLRAEPFVWFIDDLSKGASGPTDPYIILVVLMVVTQFVSSKLTMASGQQQQKALIYIFPLMMGILLYSLPSGLILYWTIFSVLSLLDWFVFKRGKMKNAEVKTA